MSHTRAYLVAVAFSVAEVLTWIAPAPSRWRWRVALLALGLMLAL